MPFELLYKCRICGEVFESGTWFGDVFGPRAFDEDSHETAQHICKSGLIGIGDLVGFKEIKE